VGAPAWELRSPVPDDMRGRQAIPLPVGFVLGHHLQVACS
jgi:hypothetical protein